MGEKIAWPWIGVGWILGALAMFLGVAFVPYQDQGLVLLGALALPFLVELFRRHH